MSTGTCTIHSWHGGGEDDDGEAPRVDEELRYDEDLYESEGYKIFETNRRNSRLRSIRFDAA